MPNLVRLGIITWSPVKSPFLNCVAPKLLQSQELYCLLGSYTSKLLRELPVCVQTIWLDTFLCHVLDVPAIERVIERSRCGQTCLEKLCIVFWRERDEEEMIKLVQVYPLKPTSATVAIVRW